MGVKYCACYKMRGHFLGEPIFKVKDNHGIVWSAAQNRSRVDVLIQMFGLSEEEIDLLFMANSVCLY